MYDGPNTPLPRQSAPDLSIALTDGTQWTLADQHPDHFTMVVFYRGLHCPVCKKYLKELKQMQSKFAERGTEVMAVSMDTPKRAQIAVEDWELGDLPVGHSLTEEQARNWGLYISEAIKDAEPERFSEPGLFLIKPDGTLFYVGINSMPFGRPHLPSMLKAIDFIQEENYPARGEVPVAQPVL